MKLNRRHLVTAAPLAPLIAAQAQDSAPVKMIVHCEEGAVAMTNVMSGQADFMFYHPAVVMPQIKLVKRTGAQVD